ncbi:uncharacterized protein [Macrobrachium rosenbergii]|uniref:uncharacterized protein n=1 Tax=Macrobrachium rosenbergii TaxID=79674 RepID=UPI0034D4EB0B
MTQYLGLIALPERAAHAWHPQQEKVRCCIYMLARRVFVSPISSSSPLRRSPEYVAMKTQLLLTLTIMGVAIGSPLAQDGSDDGYRIQSPILVPSEIFSAPTVPPAPPPIPAPVRPTDQLYSTPNQQQLQTEQELSATQQELEKISGLTLSDPVGAPAPPPPPPPPSQMKGMPYEFEWNVNDIENGLVYGHQESSDGTVAQGEYRVLLPDGRLQIVTFEDRGQGYQAQVTYQDYNV